MDAAGNAYLVGNTASANFPVASPLRATLGGNSDAFVAKIGPDADLSITNSDSRDPVMVGNNLTYTLSVSNGGQDLAAGVIVSDTLPSGAAFVSATASQGTCAGNGVLTCNLGDLAAGASASVNVVVTPNSVGTISNAATVNSGTPDHNASNNSATQETRVSALPSIAGRVKTAGGVGVGAVSVTLSGSQAATSTTGGDGFYEFADVTPGGNYSVTPSRQGFVFHPQSRSLTNVNADTTADFDAVSCVFQITPKNAAFPANGGSGVVIVNASDGLCPWTATSNAPWITITSGPAGTGTGTIAFSIAPTNSSRSGTLNIAGNVFTVWQGVSPCGEPGFTLAPRLAAGSAPYAIARGDFNADGKPDIVVLNASASPSATAASVLLGNGAGGFGPPHTTNIGGQARAVAVGDLNNDGKADIALALFGQSSNVAVLLGDGAGNLGAPTIFNAGGLPTSVAIADFNKDGKPDLAVSNEDSHNVSILLGNGAGGFGTATSIGGPGSLLHVAQQVVVGDFNKDGNQDLIVRGTFVSLVLGNGDGTFRTPTQLSLPQSGVPVGVVAVADFNKDGNQDLAYPTVPNGIAVALGNGAGGFSAPLNSSTGGRLPGHLAIADFNGDGNLDLGAVNNTFQGTQDVNALLGDGAGSFTPAPAYITGTGALDLAVADFDGDGKQDIAAVDSSLLSNTGAVAMLVGKGTGEFVGARSFVTVFSPLEVASADFNGDGKLDLIVTNATDSTFGSLSLMSGNGGGEFGVPTQIAQNLRPFSFTLLDFNHDGKLDLAVHERDADTNSKGRVKIFLGNGAGGFALSSDTLLDTFIPVVAYADFNRDGNPDLISTDLSGALTLRPGDGAGGFGTPSSFTGASNPVRLEVGDFNGDGNPDVAAATATSGCGSGDVNINVFYGNGAGGFASSSSNTFNGSVVVMLAYDFDGDGRSDLAVVNGCNKKVDVLLSKASGGFTLAGEFDAGDAPRRLALGDFNGDGRPDLVASSGDNTGFAGVLVVLAGDGAGGFSAPATFIAGRGPAPVAVGDFDGNGRVDIATTNLSASTVAVLLNSCPVAQAATTVQFGAASFSVAEGAGPAIINVTRTGDTTGTTTVEYATFNDTASDRTDYTIAEGVLRFAPGETSKSFAVSVTDDAFVEGPESLSLLLRNPSGAALGSPHDAPLGIVDNDTAASGVNPIDDAEFFVGQHYRDFLNREPDPSGLAFWTGSITSCGTDARCVQVKRANVSAAFFLSIEFQQTGYQVFRFYKASFSDSPARPRSLPRYREFLRDTQEVGRGVVVGQGEWERQLQQNTLEFTRRWVEGAEFAAQFPAAMTAQQFVDQLFANSEVAPSAAEREAAIAAFGAGGTEGRAQALLAVTNSGSVYNRQYNAAFVLMQYIGYLRRSPNEVPDRDFGGFDFWLNKLNGFSREGEDMREERVALGRVQRAEMVRAFIESVEYRQRFAP